MEFRPSRALVEPTRLRVLLFLAKESPQSFVETTRVLGIRHNNTLTSHVSVLEDAGLIKVSKLFRHRRPATILDITAKGRAELVQARDALNAVELMK
ncbi:transcriptional regulator [Bradyrhizobium sp. Ai1a-2]|uniref:transcriptional regulator n=1 Tax=Bradyrhizobium sp. Ai1a-2 TaxID=196490 RepID=UPI000685C500|nr:transcriptional regulator [Bradyrhizobium sp. Ai1a-2]